METKVFTIDSLAQFGVHDSDKTAIANGLLNIMSTRYELGIKHYKDGRLPLPCHKFMSELEDEDFREVFYKAYKQGYSAAKAEALQELDKEFPQACSLYKKAKEVDLGYYDVGYDVLYYIHKRCVGDPFASMWSMFRIGFLKGRRAEKARAKKARAR